MMVKQGLRNFFKTLKYLFTPLGVLFLALAAGFSQLIPGVVGAVRNLLSGVLTLGRDASTDLAEFLRKLADAILSLEWSSDPFGACRTLCSGEWILNTLSRICEEEFAGSITAISSLLEEAVQTIITHILLFFLMVILGMFFGYLLTGILVRRTVSRERGAVRALLAIPEAVFSTAAIFLCFYLYTVWNGLGALSILLCLLIYGAASLLIAYLFRPGRKVRLSEILTVKNVFLLLATDALIAVAALLCALLTGLLFGIAVGALTAISVFEIAILVIGRNADTYVEEVKASRDARHGEAADTENDAEHKPEKETIHP